MEVVILNHDSWVIMNLKNACVEVSKPRSMHVWLKLCNKFET